jgi:hypothetical protein
MKRSITLALALLPLAGCSLFATPTPPAEEEQASSIAETKNVIYRGTLLPLGTSIYMEGTHRLELEDGRFVLLEANGLILDDYLAMDVEVFGATRPTVEGGGIIMRVERIAEFVESSVATSSEALSSSSSVISSAMSSAAPAIPSSAPTVPSRASAAPAIPSSAPSVVSSAAPAPASSASSVANDAVSLRAMSMAKTKMDPANWTQNYCSTHINFCIPVHKNWYYVSFGATSSSLWHVELSSEELVALGDGPVSVVLVAGAAPAADGQVTTEDGKTTGIRAWTNNRHFVISAPAILETAVRYVTQELKTAPASSAPGAAQ